MVRIFTLAMVRLLVGFYCLSSAAPVIAEKFSVHRQGSELTIEVPEDWRGDWRLAERNGDTCLTGQFTKPNADGKIVINKVASDTDLVFETKFGSFEIPAKKRISPFKKLDRAARIYQLPVRTYTATARGRDGRGSFDAVTDDVLREIQDLGVDYIWLTGVLEQATHGAVDSDVIKGEAGSYYAIYDAWDASPELGGLRALENLIDRAHDMGIRVLIDLIPNHTARVHKTDVICKDGLNFGDSDDKTQFFDSNNNYFYIQGSTFIPPEQATPGADGVFDADLTMDGLQFEAPAKVTGNDVISPTPIYDDWFETIKLNYGYDIRRESFRAKNRPRTWDQMFNVAQYWVNKGVDGFRVDFAHVVPMEFWQWFVPELRAVNPEVMLIAEAYEGDDSEFRYKDLFEAGFDSIYHSYLYWRMHDLAKDPGHMRVGAPSRAPLVRDEHLETGDMFTHYMENHDELRLAARVFTPSLVNRQHRAELGVAYTAYLGLLPGNLLIHGGQEFQEDATVFGPFKGHDGRTSIFDWVYQPMTQIWLQGDRPDWMVHFRRKYQRLMELKAQPPFSVAHSFDAPSLYDLDQANWYKEQARWIGAYVRVDPSTDRAYLIVTNSDPRSAHEATIHFTSETSRDTTGVLSALGVEDSDSRLIFVEEFSRPGWSPTDPNVEGTGVPGWALYRPGGVPSGLFLGSIPAATTYVFRIDRM